MGKLRVVIFLFILIGCRHTNKDDLTKNLFLYGILTGNSVWKDTYQLPSGERGSSDSQLTPLYANGKFLVANQKGYVYSSSDGYSWNRSVVPNTTSRNTNSKLPFALAADSSIFYMGTGGGQFYYSTDGATWNDVSFNTNPYYAISSIATDGTTYVAVGTYFNGIVSLGAIFYTTTPKVAASWSIKSYSTVSQLDYVVNIGSSFYVMTNSGYLSSCTSSCSSGNFSANLTGPYFNGSVSRMAVLGGTIYLVSNNQLYSTTNITSSTLVSGAVANSINSFFVSSKMNNLIGHQVDIQGNQQIVKKSFVSADGSSWNSFQQAYPSSNYQPVGSAVMSDGSVMVGIPFALSSSSPIRTAKISDLKL